MTDRELRVLRSLVKELSALRQEMIHAKHEYEQARDASGQTYPVGPISVEMESDLRIPIAIREHYEAENRDRNSKWRKLKTSAEMVGIASAFVLAILTFLTLQEVRNQTPAIIRSAEAAKESSDASLSAAVSGIQQTRNAGETNWLTRSSLMISQKQSTTALRASIKASQLDRRAWVAVSDVRSEKSKINIAGTVFIIAFKNSGKTPAVRVAMYMQGVPRLEMVPSYDQESAGPYVIFLLPDKKIMSAPNMRRSLIP